MKMPSNWKRGQRSGEKWPGAWVGRNGKFCFGHVECDMLMNHVQWESHGDSFIGESGAQGGSWSEVILTGGI